MVYCVGVMVLLGVVVGGLFVVVGVLLWLLWRVVGVVLGVVGVVLGGGVGGGGVGGDGVVDGGGDGGGFDGGFGEFVDPTDFVISLGGGVSDEVLDLLPENRPGVPLSDGPVIRGL